MVAEPSQASAAPTRVVVLGSTGSIGVQTLEVVHALNASGSFPMFSIVGLAARRNAVLLQQQADALGVAATAVSERDGSESILRLVQQTECDLVVSAMVGAAGLAPTLAAQARGTAVAVANKETLVAAGSLIASGRHRLLPIDSEHSAIWQALSGVRLPLTSHTRLARVVITASGGPFRSMTAEEAFHQSPARALDHPRWKMGQKITIDSATMVNKAFEMIEARWLFGLRSDQIDVAVHPQSVVHSLVEFEDGALIAQLGSPDMKGPIGYALQAARTPGEHNRNDAGARRLSFKEAVSLDFEPACEKRWDALALARWVIDESFSNPSSALGAVFNAANEVAVQGFLDGRLPFGGITQICRAVMERRAGEHAGDLESVLAVDAQARLDAVQEIARAGSFAR